ncbi:MAG: hypothetical protein H7066_01865 [Cytophagaceae bacterium]|nr:hypothetical protein [Gemmatimonadaceae bacterium]
MHPWRRVGLAVLLAAGRDLMAQAKPPTVGIVSGDLGSFGATILASQQVPFVKLTTQVSGEGLLAYDVIVIDNLYRLKDLNGPAFRDYVGQGGVLVILNPKVDGFSKAWSPYDIFIGEYALEGRIVDRKHPLFQGFPNDKIEDLASSNGAFVGNCSFVEPAKEWKVLARLPGGKKNPIIVEAAWQQGHMILGCTRFDNYNAKPAATRLGDNLFRYALSLAKPR